MIAARRLALLACALACACSDVPEAGVTLAPPGSPERTAVQDRAIRALVMDVAEGRACAALDGAFVPLPEDRPARPPSELPVVEGRLWVSRCEVERRGETLALSVGGRGWRWVEESAPGPLGTSYSVRGHVRFEADVDVTADVDLRYDERGHRVLAALTPRESARARLTPIGALPVVADGGWSSVLGGLGGLLTGSSVGDRARPLVQEHGARMVQRMLRAGATLSLDLCSGQIDGALGAIADGAAPPARPYGDEEPWRDNARVRLRPGGLDASGPWAADGRRMLADLEVEDGGPAQAALLCREEAALLASEHLSTGAASFRGASTTATRGRAIALSLEAGACEEAVLVVLASGQLDVRYRYRVRREGDTREAWVRCGR